ncbi:epoxide hydrolase A-like [Triticum dicoccoides]|uniref:epoxide hydrolase A-like n=1 Tax=Triticum dicoccoides TaxID=85692 RepID=UPI00188FE945|nr:epoxide hydrolase A-like [Triticum dicoccoides]
MALDGVTHRTLEVNGIKIHVAEAGDGSAGSILFLHGFLQLWCSWHHQLVSLSRLGYRCLAPDLRGYGDSSAPESPSSYTAFHLVGDMVGLLNALSLPQVFVVGQGWGALLAWQMCAFRPERVRALVNMSVAFMPRNPAMRPLEAFRRIYGDGYYLVRMQDPGTMEAEFAQMETKFIIKKLLTTLDTGASSFSKEWYGTTEEVIPLPSWLSEEYVGHVAAKFDETGFSGAMNSSRCLDLNWELMAPWASAKVIVPTKFMVGETAMSCKSKAVQKYVLEGDFKGDVPGLEEVVVIAGGAHYIHLQKAEEVTEHIYNFFKKF